jgi:flagellar basal-body rod modification protein FlgD
MTIQPLATSPQNPHGATATSTTQPTTPQSSSDSSVDGVSENEFMQLLVAQIQYQDPTNPTDSTAFVTQLAQFSSLEQLVAIHGDLDNLTQSGAGGASNTTQGAN